jgi:hypothetical protein
MRTDQAYNQALAEAKPIPIIGAHNFKDGEVVEESKFEKELQYLETFNDTWYKSTASTKEQWDYAGVQTRTVLLPHTDTQAVDEAFAFIASEMQDEAELRSMVDNWAINKHGNTGEALTLADKLFVAMQKVLYPNQPALVVTKEYIGIDNAKGKPIYEGDMYFEEIEEDEGDERIFYVVTWLKEWAMYTLLEAVEEYDLYQKNGIFALEESDKNTHIIDAKEFCKDALQRKCD